MKNNLRVFFLFLLFLICQKNLAFSFVVDSLKNIKGNSIKVEDFSDCEVEVTLQNEETNVNHLYQVSSKITLNNNYLVQPLNGNIIMKAGSQIIMKPKTKISFQSRYLARIEPCSLCEKNFDYKNFFTPNDDGINDLWKVNWIDEKTFLGVSIYDRYGKLLKEFIDYNDYWDGYYNGSKVFSNDYWFVIKHKDCDNNIKVFKSHFTLKR